ncbi:MAG: phosphotransferase [Deltaproteobacteria bacterium]|nr:phosphotransferase [Deltaproteobacteria bacterium]
MRVPDRLVTLMDQGVIEEVLRPLMAGKEAQIYLVVSEGEVRVAKVYKEATQRSFKHRAEYTEGRKVRNTRRQRAMTKRSKYGKEQAEEVWQSAEVDAIYRLQAAGVRVPFPFDFVDGVLLMELITSPEGEPAPRLVDLAFDEAEAEYLHGYLLAQVARMLNAGVVHGDLSDFNVLMSGDGPVIIDFPQVVDPANNRNAMDLFIRDVDNLTSFLARFAPRLTGLQFGLEMWGLYEKNILDPEASFTGKVRRSRREANTGLILDEIAAAERDAVRRGLAEPTEEEPTRQRARQVVRREVRLPQEAAHAPEVRSAPQRPPQAGAGLDALDDLDAFLTVEEPEPKASRRRRRRPQAGR